MSHGAGNDMLVNNKMLRTIWIQRLPANIRSILSLSDDTVSLENLATMADKIFETSEPLQVSEIQQRSGGSNHSAEIKDLYNLIEAIAKKMSDEPRSSRSQTRERTDENKRSRSKSRAKYQVPDDANPDHCWYHQLMGAKAKNCREPCSFQKN